MASNATEHRVLLCYAALSWLFLALVVINPRFLLGAFVISMSTIGLTGFALVRRRNWKCAWPFVMTFPVPILGVAGLVWPEAIRNSFFGAMWDLLDG